MDFDLTPVDRVPIKDNIVNYNIVYCTIKGWIQKKCNYQYFFFLHNKSYSITQFSHVCETLRLVKLVKFIIICEMKSHNKVIVINNVRKVKT